MAPSKPYEVQFDWSDRDGELQGKFVWRKTANGFIRWDWGEPYQSVAVGNFAEFERDSWNSGILAPASFNCNWLRGNAPPGQVDVSCGTETPRGVLPTALLPVMTATVARPIENRFLLGKEAYCYEVAASELCFDNDGVPVFFKGAGRPPGVPIWVGDSVDVTLEATATRTVDEDFELAEELKSQWDPLPSLLVPTDLTNIPAELLE